MSMAHKQGFIWMDGQWVGWREAKVHPLTQTLHYGMGVFEGVRAYNGEQGPAIFRLHCHTKRLLRSAHILNIDVPYTHEELVEIQKEVLLKNKLSNAYIRPMIYLGSETMGLNMVDTNVNVMVAAWEWGSLLGEEALRHGVRIRTSSFARHFSNSAMHKAKANGNYINSMLAAREAKQSGVDEALLLDVNGHVAEGSGENIFIVRDNIVYTPDLSACLDGITRDTVIRFLRSENYEVQEKRITRDEVYIADEAFFTGTAAEITPIVELDRRKIGTGLVGSLTKKVQSAYFDLVYARKVIDENWISVIKPTISISVQ